MYVVLALPVPNLDHISTRARIGVPVPEELCGAAAAGRCFLAALASEEALTCWAGPGRGLLPATRSPTCTG